MSKEFIWANPALQFSSTDIAQLEDMSELHFHLTRGKQSLISILILFALSIIFKRGSRQV
jgi:hypothetical protein